MGCTSQRQRDGTRSILAKRRAWTSNGTLGAHQLRFGLDHETNTSAHEQYYPGPERLLYEIRRTTVPTLENGARAVPVGTEYVRTRQNEVDGEFETINSAYYLEDNWSVTDNLVLNAGVRVEGFDNKNSDGDSYIKMDDMIAPRFGFSWDMKGDSRSKLFGNAGRYFLPVANVINIKQAGGFLDARTFYRLRGFETVRAQRHHAPAADPRCAARRRSTTRRATAPSATCAAKSIRIWIRSIRTS